MRPRSADNDELRPEEVAQAGDGHAERARCVGDHAPATGVAVERPVDDLMERQLASVPAPERFEHALRADERLEAPAVAAAADRPGLVDREVADLACRSGEAAVDVSVKHEAGAHA